MGIILLQPALKISYQLSVIFWQETPPVFFCKAATSWPQSGKSCGAASWQAVQGWARTAEPEEARNTHRPHVPYKFNYFPLSLAKQPHGTEWLWHYKPTLESAADGCQPQQCVWKRGKKRQRQQKTQASQFHYSATDNLESFTSQILLSYSGYMRFFSLLSHIFFYKGLYYFLDQPWKKMPGLLKVGEGANIVPWLYLLLSPPERLREQVAWVSLWRRTNLAISLCKNAEPRLCSFSACCMIVQATNVAGRGQTPSF